MDNDCPVAQYPHSQAEIHCLWLDRLNGGDLSLVGFIQRSPLHDLEDGDFDRGRGTGREVEL